MTMAPIAMSVDLQEELQKQLNIDEVFGFDVKGVHIGFDESTVVSWHFSKRPWDRKLKSTYRGL